MINSIGTTDKRPICCTVFEPITYSGSKDSNATIKQIREHNAKYEELCGSLKEK